MGKADPPWRSRCFAMSLRQGSFPTINSVALQAPGISGWSTWSIYSIFVCEYQKAEDLWQNRIYTHGSPRNRSNVSGFTKFTIFVQSVQPGGPLPPPKNKGQKRQRAIHPRTEKRPKSNSLNMNCGQLRDSWNWLDPSSSIFLGCLQVLHILFHGHVRLVAYHQQLQ